MWPRPMTCGCSSACGPRSRPTRSTTRHHLRVPAERREKIPVLGVQNDQIVTIPFFATPRVDAGTVSMADPDRPAQRAGRNCSRPSRRRGAHVLRLLARYQPAERAGVPDPGAGRRRRAVHGRRSAGAPIQSFARSDHQCLIAEISYDPDPITTGADPSNTDKLAQRNLAFVNVPNPGQTPSRLVPQTFEVRPSPAVLRADSKPDELRLDFSELPDGCQASIYLPAAAARGILVWATDFIRPTG